MNVVADPWGSGAGGALWAPPLPPLRLDAAPGLTFPAFRPGGGSLQAAFGALTSTKKVSPMWSGKNVTHVSGCTKTGVAIVGREAVAGLSRSEAPRRA